MNRGIERGEYRVREGGGREKKCLSFKGCTMELAVPLTFDILKEAIPEDDHSKPPKTQNHFV